MRRVSYTTNSIESRNYQLREVTNRGHFPADAAAVQLLRLAICPIEDQRAAERAKETGLTAGKRRSRFNSAPSSPLNSPPGTRA